MHNFIVRLILIVSSTLVVAYTSNNINVYSAITFTPGSTIALTGSNEAVFFDVADDIFASGSSVSGPVLHTSTSTFSGAFYLSGAGWVDFSTGAYSVSLDCGVQTLNALIVPCTLSGTAYSENIGDIIFDRRVVFDPGTGYLSGTVSTYAGEYLLGSIILPIFPTEFQEGKTVIVDHAKVLTISGSYLFYGPNPWMIHVQPSGGTDVLYTGAPYDLSHASIYRIEIIDPNGSSTVIHDFEALSDIPSTILSPLAGSVRENFCSINPSSLLCPEGILFSPTNLIQSSSVLPVVGNGSDQYNFILKLRDRYGNPIDTGTIRVEYSDSIRDIQDIGTFPYMPLPPGWTIQTSGDLHNYLDGTPTTGDIPTNIGNLTYEISSIAPTSPTDVLVLSGVLYTDDSGNTLDITSPTWKSPLSFAPWYTTSLITGSIVIGETVGFSTTFQNKSPAVSPNTPSAIYNISIGSNTFASFSDFSSGDPIFCTKYVSSIGMNECNWFGFPDPVVISTAAGSFSGLYTPMSYEPPPETLAYTSYITYETGGIRILYPSASNTSLGLAVAGIPRMKILGQHNLPSLSNPGIGDINSKDIWNVLHRKIAILSRNRTNYTDANYDIKTGDISLDASSFGGLINKRTLVSYGGNITITGNIPINTSPIAILALTDTNGDGGDIIVESGVTDIHATLFAEKSVSSTGANQLYIHGSVISHNSVSNSECPYYLSSCVNPEKYNLENLRTDYLTTPGNASLYSTNTGRYPNIPLLIEYDGRILSDPPPGLDK